MASATGNVAEAVLPLTVERAKAKAPLQAMRSKFVCDVCRAESFPTRALAMEHERNCSGGGGLSGVISRNGPGGPAPEEAAGIPTWDAALATAAAVVESTITPKLELLQRASSQPKLAVDEDGNHAVLPISKGPSTRPDNMMGTAPHTRPGKARPEAIIILDVTPPAVATITDGPAPPIPKITPKSALLQTISKTKHWRKETKKRKRDDHRARMQRQLELMACRGENNPERGVDKRGSPLSGSSSSTSSLSPVGGSEGGVVDLCGSGASDGSEMAAGSGNGSGNDRTGQTVVAAAVSRNGQKGARKEGAHRSNPPAPSAGEASPPIQSEGAARGQPRIVNGNNHANNGSPFAKRKVAPGSVASRALAALEDDSSEEECSGGEGDDDDPLPRSLEPHGASNAANSNEELGLDGDDDPPTPRSVAPEGTVRAMGGGGAPRTARASATTSSIMRSFRERRLELLERRLRKHYRRKRQREWGRDGAVDGSSSNAGGAPGDAISVESIGPTSNDIVWIDSDTSDGAEGGNRTSSVPPEQPPRERKCPSQCTPGPKYPSGCPVWFNMQYSKPCSTYLMSDRGIVKSALWDRRTGRFVYRVEKNREIISVAEDDLAFAVRCPVYLKKEGGEISEMAGEVIHVKPIARNDGQVTRLYTVMLTMDEGAVKVEEGVVPDRLRYRCRLATLQSRIRDTTPTSRSQKGFGIRSNKEGEPMQNKARPVMRRRRRCPSPIASAEDSSSSEDDSSATETEEEEDSSRPLNKRQKQTRDSVDSALHSSRPADNKRRKKSFSYTGAVWKKRERYYEARVYLNSKVQQIPLGTFQHLAEAALAHDVGARLLKKSNCNFNFPSRQAYNLALQAEMESKGQSVDVDASFSAVLDKAKARVAKLEVKGDEVKTSLSAFIENNGGAGGDRGMSNAEGDFVSAGEQEKTKSTADAETNASIDDKCSAVEAEEEGGSLKRSNERRNEASGSRHPSSPLLPMESESEKKKTSCCTGVSGAQKKSKSGYRGVTWRERAKRYDARVWFNSKIHSMGYYKYKADAALAYDAATKMVKGESHRLNFSSKQGYDLAIKAEMDSKGRSVDVDASYSAVLAKVKAKMEKLLICENENITSSVKNDVGRDMGGREKDRQVKSTDNGGVNDHAALPRPPKNQFKEAASDAAVNLPSATVPLSSESLAELDDSPMHALATAMRTMSRGRDSNDAKKEMAAATSDGASDDSDEEEDGDE